jgi:chromosomal replication initiator protein
VTVSTDTAVNRDGVAARIAQRLERSLGTQRYRMWFERSARFAFDDQSHSLGVAVPNRFVADWIGRHFEQDLRSAAVAEAGEGVALQVRVEPDLFNNAAHGSAAAAPVDRETRPQPSSPRSALAQVQTLESTRRNLPLVNDSPVRTPALDGSGPSGYLRHRLDDFIVGPSNELAFAAAVRFVEDDAVHAAQAGQTLFIHGGCGLGKTHLLQGVCRRLLEQQPDAAVHYTTGEQFTNAFLTAVRTSKIDAFRRRLRRLDLLAVDDVHFIANKAATQQEFLHSFDALELGGAKVVLASDCHPKLIKQFSEALVSRCVRGMVVQVSSPDAATRLKVIQVLAARRGLLLMDGVAETLAQHGRASGGAGGSVREIEGALVKLQALAQLDHQRIPASAVNGNGTPLRVGQAVLRQLLDESQRGSTPRLIRLDTILKTVCDRLGVTAAQVNGRGRHRQVVHARALTIHLARQLTTMSFPEIAAAMGRPNHSTIITAAQRIQAQIESNTDTVILPATMEALTIKDLAQRLRDAVVGA